MLIKNGKSIHNKLKELLTLRILFKGRFSVWTPSIIIIKDLPQPSGMAGLLFFILLNFNKKLITIIFN